MLFPILRSWKMKFKNGSFLSFFRIVRSRRNRLCTQKILGKKSLISRFFVFSEAERMKLKSVHFWAFFVFSETEKTDFAHKIIWSRNAIPRSRKNGFYHILGTASRNRNLRFQSWDLILGTKKYLEIREISGNF